MKFLLRNGPILPCGGELAGGGSMNVSYIFCIGATIRTHREIQCLPYEAFKNPKEVNGGLMTLLIFLSSSCCFFPVSKSVSQSD